MFHLFPFLFIEQPQVPCCLPLWQSRTSGSTFLFLLLFFVPSHPNCASSISSLGETKQKLIPQAVHQKPWGIGIGLHSLLPFKGEVLGRGDFSQH